MSKMGSKGWSSGESTGLPPIWPGFRKSWRRIHTCIEFVVGSLICSERFFSGYSGFTLSWKTNISKFLFDQESRRRKLTKNHFVDVLPLNRWLFYLFIYLFIWNGQYLLVLRCLYCPKQWHVQVTPFIAFVNWLYLQQSKLQPISSIQH